MELGWTSSRLVDACSWCAPLSSSYVFIYCKQMTRQSWVCIHSASSISSGSILPPPGLLLLLILLLLLLLLSASNCTNYGQSEPPPHSVRVACGREPLCGGDILPTPPLHPSLLPVPGALGEQREPTPGGVQPSARGAAACSAHLPRDPRGDPPGPWSHPPGPGGFPPGARSGASCTWALPASWGLPACAWSLLPGQHEPRLLRDHVWCWEHRQQDPHL